MKSKLLPAHGYPIAVGTFDREGIGQRIAEIGKAEEGNPWSSGDEENICERPGRSYQQVLKRSALLPDGVKAFGPLYTDVFDLDAKKQRCDQMPALVEQHCDDTEAETLRERKQPAHNGHHGGAILPE